MNEQYDKNQAGFSIVGVVISLGLASGVALLGAQVSSQAKKVVNPLKKQSDVMDLQHYINENFDCMKTVEKITCDGSKIDTYRPDGSLLTSSVGTDFYRHQQMSNKYEFVVNASCNDNHFDFFYTFKTPYMEQEDEEEHLFGEIPIACGLLAAANSGPCEQGVDVLTFEEFANGDPIPNNAFEAQYGITLNPNRPLKIAPNGNTTPVVKGGPDYAFLCNNCPGKNVPNGVGDDSDHEIGDYFLTDVGKGTDFEMEVNYTTPVFGASGSLMDLDGKEEWIVKAYSGSTLVYSETYKGKRGGDAKPTVWKVENDPPVAFDRLVLTGTDKGSQFGLAFDNFSPSSVCETFSLP